MAPGQKRKRNERTFSQDSNDSSSRPSPHRPQSLNLAQQNQQYGNQIGGRGGRRSSRGGRGGSHQGPRSPISTPNSQSSNRPSPTSNHAMSPPPTRPATNSNSTSRPSTPSVTQHTPSIPPPLPSPSAQLPYYYYEHLTNERMKAWQSSGRQAVIDAGIEAREEEDELALDIIFQELIKAAVDSKVDAADCGRMVKAILAGATDTDTLSATQFLDTVSLLTECDMSGIAALRILLPATGISSSLMREVLDGGLLTQLGLVRSTFDRMSIRNSTNVLYRQSAYNLLREETEGYSKLMTEYFTTTNSEPPSGEVVTETFEKVKALIGAFDLDVGRVLDVTLDVFANLLVKHYRFFIKLLRVSSWWPERKVIEGAEWQDQGFESLPKWALPSSQGWTTSEEEKEQLAMLKEQRDIAFWDRTRQLGMDAFYELGGRRLLSDKAMFELTDGKFGSNAISAADRNWISCTGTAPPPGNRIAAQLLGFKLRFYASQARDKSDVLPDNLIYLVALLIKIGFVSLRDIYPHLYPADDQMEEVRKRLMEEKDEREKKKRPGGGVNALLMAGALSDDTVSAPATSRLRELENSRATPGRSDSTTQNSNTPTSTSAKAEEVPKDALPEPADQKVHLLKSLLCIGAIPEALFILGRFPWLPDAYPELPEFIHRILHHSLSNVYGKLQPLADRKGVSEAKPTVSDASDLPKGHLKLAQASPKKILRWANMDKDAGDGVVYHYYWDEWTDNVPVCRTVDDVFSLCDTLLNYSGVKIGQDSALLLKLVRIGKWSLQQDVSDKNVDRWIGLSKRLLVPALSLTKSNPGIVDETFELLKLFPLQERYWIYAEWNKGAISRLPDIADAFALARAETRDVLKRISKTNTKTMARALAKIAYSSPGIVFNVALVQIESYDNLIEVIVECARYFTFLGYDVLTWSLMSSLGDVSRNRVQADGMLTSAWLRALSAFAGKVFKRYSTMNVTPILQYVAKQLRDGESTYLEVLEQIVTSMAGVRSDLTFNDSQLIAMAGGPVIQSLTLESLLDKRHEMKNTSKRLVRALMENNLAAQLLISIAQERQLYAFRNSISKAPLKVVGINLDQIHQIFAQYLDFLRSNIAAKDFDAAVPGITTLISDFGIEPCVAFAICRQSITSIVTEYDVAQQKDEKDKKDKEKAAHRRESNSANEKPQINGDVEMADDDSKDAVQGTQLDTATKKVNGIEDVEMKDSASANDLPTPEKQQHPSPKAVQDPWHPMLMPIMAELKEILPVDFEDRLSLTFYTTFWQLSLHEIQGNMDIYKEVSKKLIDKVRAIGNDRSDLSAAGLKKKDLKKKEAIELNDRITEENSTHVMHSIATKKRLQREKRFWFPEDIKARRNTADALIQDCFIPRIFLSPLDALYTWKMIMCLHSIATPGFSTMFLFEQWFNQQRLTALFFQCTSREADNFGRFLNEVLSTFLSWWAKASEYESYALGANKRLLGFVRKFDAAGVPKEFLEYEDFRRLLFKWHSQLFRALKACLESGEYMHIRNAIIILKHVHKNFPKTDNYGKQLNEVVTGLSANEERDDIKLAAASLLGDLRKQEKRWVTVPDFRTQSEAELEAASRAASAKANMPLPPASNTLNASAPDFKPTSNAPNGVSKTTVSGKLEVEDGEIDDARKADAKERKGDAASNVATPAAAKPDLPIAPSQAKATVPKTSEQAPAVQQLAPQATKAITEQRGPILATSTAPPPAGGLSRPVDTPRPEMSRPSSQHGRTPHALPSRPEVQMPRGRVSERPTDRPSEYPRHRHDDRGHGDYGRLDRPGESARDSFGDYRGSSPGHRGRARSPERSHNERERRDPGWPPAGRDAQGYPDERGMRLLPRDSRPPGRNQDYPPHARDRPGLGHEPVRPPIDSRPRQYPASNMGPPESGALAQQDRNGAVNPDRSMPIQPAVGVNPERAALIERATRTRPDDFRSERDSRDGRGQQRSRPQSPNRVVDDRLPIAPPLRSDGVRGERRDAHAPSNDRHQSSNYPPSSRDRRDEPGANAPTGPRGDRSSRTEQPDNAFTGRPGRELFNSAAPPRPPQDPNHGRLSQDFTSQPPRQQDPNYGRLNASADIPTAPRASNRGGRGGRNFTAPSHGTASGSVPQSPSTDRHPPSGPNHDRRERREAGPAEIPATSAPPLPEGEQQAPDLLGVHPSRLEAFKPPPLQTTNITSAPLAQTPTSAYPPSGPRIGGGPPRPSPSTFNNSHNLPSPTTRNLPSGPASANDRPQGDKRFAGIQNIIQQSTGDRGASIRGRAGRPLSYTAGGASSSPATSSAPNAPVIRGDAGPPRSDQDRAPPGPETGLALDENHSDGRNGRRREGRGEGRSGRHRSSRSHSPRGDRGDVNRRERDEPSRPSRGGADGHRNDGERDGGRRRDEGRDRERDRHRDGERERDRDRRDGAARPDQRNEYRGPQMGMLPMPMPNGDGRLRGGEGRRGEDRDRRDGRGGGERKRSRVVGDDGGMGESKRPRRGQ